MGITSQMALGLERVEDDCVALHCWHLRVGEREIGREGERER
jgi:hypothetical protein